jgi:hypothetical protein
MSPCFEFIYNTVFELGYVKIFQRYENTGNNINPYLEQRNLETWEYYGYNHEFRVCIFYKKNSVSNKIVYLTPRQQTEAVDYYMSRIKELSRQPDKYNASSKINL